jgi:hypothetical protein
MKILDQIFNAAFVLAVIVMFLMHAEANAREVIALPEVVVQAQSPQITFRDDRSRTTGTAAKTGNTTTYRDDRGRTSGTATVDSAGTTTFRDELGRTVGTAAAPRSW